MADTKTTALTENRTPDLLDLLYMVDDPSGTPTSQKTTFDSASKAAPLDSETPPTAIWDEVQEGPGSGFFEIGDAAIINLVSREPGFSQFRLTTETAVPVSTSDRTAQGTMYLTNNHGNLLSLCDGKRWRLYESAEIPLVFANVVSGKNYDAFAYLHPTTGVPTWDFGTAWTNDTTRALAVSRVNGAFVNTAQFTSLVNSHTVGALQGFWLGTVRADGTNTVADSIGGVTTQIGGKRFVWNAYNQIARQMSVIDTANSWTYTTDAWRVANGATGPLNCVEYVCGLAGGEVSALALQAANAADGGFFFEGIGVDSTTARSGLAMPGYNQNSSSGGNVNFCASATYSGNMALGYHYISWLENGGGSGAGVTFYGDNGETNKRQSGLTASIWA